jgi:hypothetical protein
MDLDAAVPPTTAALTRVWDDRQSLICKTLRAGNDGPSRWAGQLGAGDPYYWRREALVYAHNLPGRLAGRLRGPACHGVFDRADGSVAIWLEDLATTTPGSRWPYARYGEAAFDLGVAQGNAARHVEQFAPWLSRSWLRAYIARSSGDIELLADSSTWKEHALGRAYITADVFGAIRMLWDIREWFLTRLERLPRTLCQLDLHPNNLFADDHGTVLIDWAYAGVGAVGEDVGNLALDALWDFHLPPSAAPELSRLLLEGYHDGLNTAGLRISIEVVELGLTASACVKYLWILPAMLRALADGRELLNHRPIAETFPVWAQILPHVVHNGERALDLAHHLGIALPR